MKAILLIILIISFNLSAAEVRINLAKSSVYAGEIVDGKVTGYGGPVIKEKMLDENIYILYLDQIESKMIFVQPPATNTAKLDEKDYLVWNPVQVIKLEAAGVQLEAQAFEFKKYYWVLPLLLIVLLASLGVWLYFTRIKPWSDKKSKKRALKEEIFAANNFEEISLVWKRKHIYLDQFPFMEDEFNKFEAVYYRYAFKPQLSEDESKEILRSYLKMLDQVRGGPFGV